MTWSWGRPATDAVVAPGEVGRATTRHGARPAGHRREVGQSWCVSASDRESDLAHDEQRQRLLSRLLSNLTAIGRRPDTAVVAAAVLQALRDFRGSADARKRLLDSVASALNARGWADHGVAVAADVYPIEIALLHVRSSCRGVFGAATNMGDLASLDAAEVASLGPATVQRQHEFAIGRAALHEAMRSIGVSNAVVPIGAEGAPAFPPGIVGSIAHKEGRAVAVVARRESQLGIGVDLELDEDDPRDEADLRDALADDMDVHTTRRLEALGFRSPATAVWAAKESVLKAVYPLLSSPIDLDQVQVRFDPDDSAFWARIGGFGRTLTVNGSFALEAGWLVALATVRVGECACLTI